MKRLQQHRARRASKDSFRPSSGATRSSRASLSLSRTPSNNLQAQSTVTMRFPELDIPSKTLKPVNRKSTKQKLVFLAGGIAAPADTVPWRSTVLQDLASRPGLQDVVLMNPYFKKVKGIDMSEQLTNWEMDHFAKSDLIVFFFHRHSPCMVRSCIPTTLIFWARLRLVLRQISLLEFGQWAVPQAQRPKGKYYVLVGADPEYERRATLGTYCAGRHKLYDSVEALTQAVAALLRTM